MENSQLDTTQIESFKEFGLTIGGYVKKQKLTCEPAAGRRAW